MDLQGTFKTIPAPPGPVRWTDDEPPQTFPVLRRTCRAINVLHEDPFACLFLPCRLVGATDRVEVKRDGEWDPVDWRINPTTLNIIFRPSSFMGSYESYTVPSTTFEYVRLRFSAVTVFFVLKLKILAKRRERRRFVSALLPDTVNGRKRRSPIGALLATFQRWPVRRRVAEYLGAAPASRAL